jgi:TonB-dependent SusC/RagA subfamily outer membrane receptor
MSGVWSTRGYAQQSNPKPAYAVIPASVSQPDPQHVSIKAHDMPISDVLRQIATKAGMALGWSRERVPLEGKVTVSLNDVSVWDAFSVVLKGTGVEAKLSPDGQTIILVRQGTEISEAQASGIVAGVVVDSVNGQGLRGVTVQVRGTRLTAVTNDSGRFVLRNVPTGDHTLSLRLAGYRQVLRSVTVVDGTLVALHILMHSVATVLSGVVTTATGVQRKVEVGNDITTINVDSVMKVAPITSVTDLLETRVPGLTVLHSSGTPGDPSRIRLRGASSITGNNDPIVIVDGMRVYASQSDARNSNLAGSAVGGVNYVTGTGQSSTEPGKYATPSPLDQIDPNTIESIEVFKGPSATALYGSDAANGVIVITTKHGQPGRTHWNLTLGQGVNWVPGNWPVNYFRFGSNSILQPNDAESWLGSGVCVWYDTQCQTDSIVAFQALNDSRYTVFSHGRDQNGSLTVSGGVSTLLYSFTGSARSTTGNLQLPVHERQRYEKFYGPISNSLVHPDRYTQWGGSGQLSAQPSSNLSLTWNSALLQRNQQRSSLEQAITQLQGIYIDPAQLANTGLITDEYERATDRQLSATNGITLNWQASSWLRINATGGLNTIQKTDETFIPYGVNSASPGDLNGDTTGSYGLGRGTSKVFTLSMGTVIPMQVVNTALGFNYTDQAISDVSAYTSQLAPGVTRPTTFPTALVNGKVPSYFRQSTTAASTYGWYVQPTLHLHSRFFVSPGFRLDGGSASGANAGLTGFPKIDFSYIAVNPDHPAGVLTLLRPRIAFGYAGTQPNPTQKLRLFNVASDGTPVVSLDGGATYVPLVELSSLGNTQLRPERTGEIEGGFDAGFGNDRVQLTVTAYNKTRHDAIISVPLPPSVSGNGTAGAQISKNIGVVRNTGAEVWLTARLLDSRAVSWTATTNFSQDKNRVVRLNPDESTIIVGNSRVEAGYPLWSVWERPIVSFVDANRNGIIEYDEIRLGDSAAFVGQTDPKYQLNASSTLTLLNGRMSVTADVAYQNGFTQTQGSVDRSNTVLLNLPNAPGVSLATQAAVVAGTLNDQGIYTSSGVSGIGLTQTVNTLRLSSLSISYQLSSYIAHLFRAQTMSIALQGSNLGLHTNYRGMDPNVNTFSTASQGDALQDTGQLSQPRTWSLSIRMGN